MAFKASVAVLVALVLWPALPATGQPQPTDDSSLTWAPLPVQDARSSTETPMGDGGADSGWAVTCDSSGAVQTGTPTIPLSDIGVAPRCIVATACDLVTWVNTTANPLAIQTGLDQFSTDDL